jgi:hypothetical protein
MKSRPFCPQGHHLPSTECYICPSGPAGGMGFFTFRMFWKIKGHVASKLVCVFCPNLSLPSLVWMLVELSRLHCTRPGHNARSDFGRGMRFQALQSCAADVRVEKSFANDGAWSTAEAQFCAVIWVGVCRLSTTIWERLLYCFLLDRTAVRISRCQFGILPRPIHDLQLK